MTNIPTRTGGRYLCFVVEREDRGYSWNGHHSPQIWRCVECGTRFRGVEAWSVRRLAEHHECGHAPCAYCGTPLLRRKDGSPRQHAANRCPGKNPGFRVEREFAHNITAREYQ